MLGQGTSILTSTIGAGIIESHKKMMSSERASQGLSSSGTKLINDDAFTASVVMILSGVNSFMYQLALFPLYTLIALQKTIVCTANDIFGIFDVTGFVIRVGKPDLQRASDVSSGVCLTAFFEKSINGIGETGTSDALANGASDMMRDVGQSASSIMIAGATGQDAGMKSSRIIDLFSGSRGGGAAQMSDAIQDAPRQKGGKMQTMFEKFKGAKFVGKLGNMMGKLQLKAPIHLIDSMITYAIGVISGMQDMAQVLVIMFYPPSFLLGLFISYSLPSCGSRRLVMLTPSGTKKRL